MDIRTGYRLLILIHDPTIKSYRDLPLPFAVDAVASRDFSTNLLFSHLARANLLVFRRSLRRRWQVRRSALGWNPIGLHSLLGPVANVKPTYGYNDGEDRAQEKE